MKNLKKIRKVKNITQIRLSIAAEVSQETISAYESGKALPSVETLIKMANFLDTTTDYLLDISNNPIPVNIEKNSNSDKLIYNFNKLSDNDKKDVIWYCEAKAKKNEQY